MWLNVRARLAESKHEASINAFKVAHGEVTPYDAMTRMVEEETGTLSSTWNMIDKRWDRVVYLTRALLGIPHESPRNMRGMNKEKAAA